MFGSEVDLTDGRPASRSFRGPIDEWSSPVRASRRDESGVLVTLPNR